VCNLAILLFSVLKMRMNQNNGNLRRLDINISKLICLINWLLYRPFSAVEEVLITTVFLFFIMRKSGKWGGINFSP